MPARLGGRIRVRSGDGDPHTLRFDPPLEGADTFAVPARGTRMLVLAGAPGGSHDVFVDGGNGTRAVITIDEP